MATDTNPRVKCHYCNKDVIHHTFYSHLASKHFDDLWTSENKGKVEDALKGREIKPLPLVVKGYDLFLYFSPVSGKIYTKMKSAQSSLNGKTEEEFKAPLRSLFTVAEPASKKVKVVVKEVVKVVKEGGLDADEALALRRLLHMLYSELRDARETIGEEKIPEDETLLSYCEGISLMKKEIGYLKTISLEDSVKCMRETHTGEKPQKKIEVEELPEDSGLGMFFEEEAPKPQGTPLAPEPSVAPSVASEVHSPPEKPCDTSHMPPSEEHMPASIAPPSQSSVDVVAEFAPPKLLRSSRNIPVPAHAVEQPALPLSLTPQTSDTLGHPHYLAHPTLQTGASSLPSFYGAPIVETSSEPRVLTDTKQRKAPKMASSAAQRGLTLF